MESDPLIVRLRFGPASTPTWGGHGTKSKPHYPGDDLLGNLPRCVCLKVREMGLFWA